MTYNEFKGLKIPRLGFGAMRLPTISGKEVDYETTAKMFKTAMDAGVNYFDTSKMYHGGLSERAIKKCLVERFPRDSFMVADKVPPWQVSKTGDYMKIFEQEAKACGVDFFDFYLIHSLDAGRFAETEKLGGFEFMQKLKRDGKATHIGFSFHGTTKALDDILTAHPEMEFAQLQINYMDWYDGMAKEWQETAIKHKTPIIIMEPVKGGTLASLPPEAEAVFKAADPGASVSSWAIRFAASLDGVLTVLSGMSNLDQVADNLKTMGDFKPLSAEEHEVIEKALDAYRGVSYIPCTACRYCADCPQGIEIDQIFSIYNQYKRTGNKWPLTQMYGCLDANTNINNCTECGTCVSACPQKIDVPEKFKEIKKVVS